MHCVTPKMRASPQLWRHSALPKCQTSPTLSRTNHTSSANSIKNLTLPFLSLLNSCTSPLSLSKIHSLLIVHGLTTSLPFQTKLLTSYGSFGKTAMARKVFDRIPNPDLYSCKDMIKCYISNDCYSEAIGFYQNIRRFIEEQDNVIFSLVVKSCTKLLDLNEGRKLHCHIVKVGNPDCFLLDVLTDMYAKCGDLGGSRRMFDEIPERNVVSWTSIISGCVQNCRPKEGLVLFNKMRLENVEPTEHTIGSLLMACSVTESLHQGKWIHGFVLKIGMGMNSFISTSLLDMYVKCGEVTEARFIFDELPNVDVVSWTAMIVGYTNTGLSIEALKLFVDKKWAGLVSNSITIATAFSAAGKLRVLDLGRSIHAVGIKLGLEDDSVVKNALVDMYAKCSAIREADFVFDRILEKDVVTWNAMIAGYSQNGFGYCALELFKQMRSNGCLPDAITVVSAISACACMGALYIGCSFHGYAKKYGFPSNIYVGTALINFYNKCGDLLSARRVFDEMSNRNTVTWCAMLGGYGMQGDSTSSLNLFSKMLEQELMPNDVTFTSVLSTCSHGGMVDEGQKFFESMSRNFNIVPSMKHYACMVDMLARAGNLEEALQFIERMPVRADVSVWGALLHGCRIHSRLDIGEVAAKRVMELEPETPDYYVLMSNMYASDGRWAEAVKIRELMKEKGMIKSPGCSFIKMDGRLHPIALTC